MSNNEKGNGGWNTFAAIVLAGLLLTVVPALWQAYIEYSTPNPILDNANKSIQRNTQDIERAYQK